MNYTMKYLKILAFLFGLFSVPGTAAADMTGRASVIDGDTLEIRGERIRLWGIDAPESDQICSIAGKAYRCGQQAALALDELAGGKTVSCQEKYTDKFNRTVAECFVSEININAAMVRTGQAVAASRYSRDFLDEQNTAKATKAGLWAGKFQMPWNYRHGPR